MDDLVLYDTENTDLDPVHGQITQFAGVIANPDLEITDQLNTHIRLLPWVIPMPAACRVTKVPPHELTVTTRQSEFDAASIMSQFLKPGYNKTRCYVTYNGLDHDDHYIRQVLFRNLQKPWFNSGKQAIKVDLYPLMQLINSVDSSAFNIPVAENGKFSYKLENVCQANGIEIDAHDALGDVLACLELVKAIKTRAPWAWDHALLVGNHLNVEKILSSSARDGKPVWLFTHFGQPEIRPFFPVCHNGQNKWLLVSLETEDYPRSFEAGYKETVFKPGPFKQIATKACPFVLTDEIVARCDISFDASELNRRAEMVKADTAFSQMARISMVATQYETPLDQTNDEKIYGGFPDRETESTMFQFINAKDWPARVACRFPNDQRFREFAARILLDADIHGEHTLTDDQRSQLQVICQGTIMRPYGAVDCRWSTLQKAIEDGPDAAWLDWALERYGEVDCLVQARNQSVEPMLSLNSV